MKQRITKKQWDELNNDQKKKFWGGEIKCDSSFREEPQILPDIGQMIEFLASVGSVSCEQWQDESKAWRVGINWVDADNYDFVCEQQELCDALWMAVSKNIPISEIIQNRHKTET